MTQAHVLDLGLQVGMIPIFCGNTSVIYITKNLIEHSHIKHIGIRYHFIRYHIVKGDLNIQFVNTENQLIDIFTKALNYNRFNSLRTQLGVIFHSN